MIELKTDFSKRDENNRLPLPENRTFKHGDSVLLYDEDLSVEGYVVFDRKGKKFIQISWNSVQISGFKDPPQEVQEEYKRNPVSARQGWWPIEEIGDSDD